MRILLLIIQTVNVQRKSRNLTRGECVEAGILVE